MDRFSIGGWHLISLDYFDVSVKRGCVNGCALLAPDTSMPVSLALLAYRILLQIDGWNQHLVRIGRMLW